MNNRIKKYFEDEKVESPREHKVPQKDTFDGPLARCVIVSDIYGQRVVMSVDGTQLIWQWSDRDDGLYCPGTDEPVKIDSLAAESLVHEEVFQFLAIQNINQSEVIYVNTGGEKIDGVFFHPKCAGELNYDTGLKKEKINELYKRYIMDGDNISEELIGEAISFGVLKPFLSLINLG